MIISIHKFGGLSVQTRSYVHSESVISSPKLLPFYFLFTSELFKKFYAIWTILMFLTLLCFSRTKRPIHARAKLNKNIYDKWMISSVQCIDWFWALFCKLLSALRSTSIDLSPLTCCSSSYCEWMVPLLTSFYGTNILKEKNSWQWVLRYNLDICNRDIKGDCRALPMLFASPGSFV